MTGYLYKSFYISKIAISYGWSRYYHYIPVEYLPSLTVFSALASATFKTEIGSECKILKSSPGGLTIFLYCAETMPSPSTRSTLFSKLEKLLPVQRSLPRSSTNFSTLSWKGSRFGSLQATTLLLPKFLTYLTRSVRLNGSGVGDRNRRNKIIPIAHTRASTMRKVRNWSLHGILSHFMMCLADVFSLLVLEAAILLASATHLEIDTYVLHVSPTVYIPWRFML